MSKRISDEEYQKTLSFRFRQWLDGTRDPYLGNVEMKKQETFRESAQEKTEREKERRRLKEKVYDLENNLEVRIFNRFYKVFSVLFCIFLVAMLLVAVSDLPLHGKADNPVNNEVAERYIEKGMQETGAVNIVTGMILDYRAFDTLGESHVLFVATCTVLILLRSDRKGDKEELSLIHI